jgi:GT2 family glycosyltransferase
VPIGEQQAGIGQCRQHLLFEILAIPHVEGRPFEDEEPGVDPVVEQSRFLSKGMYATVLVEHHGSVRGGKRNRGQSGGSPIARVMFEQAPQIDVADAITVGNHEPVAKKRTATLYPPSGAGLGSRIDQSHIPVVRKSGCVARDLIAEVPRRQDELSITLDGKDFHYVAQDRLPTYVEQRFRDGLGLWVGPGTPPAAQNHRFHRAGTVAPRIRPAVPVTLQRVGVSTGDLAVVIPTRDRWHVLRRTLDALDAQSVSGFEIVVVVDGDDSGPSELRGARMLRTAKGGPGRARNLGVEETARPLVLFLGDDIIPTSRLVEKHLDGHERHTERESAVLGLSVWHPELRRNRVMRWMEWSGTQFDYDGIQGHEAGWGRFYSSNVSVKRDFFREVGGFDLDFEYDYEDLDFAYRANAKGLMLWYEPAALGQHFHPYDLKRLAGRYGSHAVGERLMSKKHSWFSPFFAARIDAATSRRRVSPVWPLLADAMPVRFAGLRSRSREMASVWFHQQFADAFRSSWDGQEDLEELRDYLGDNFDVHKLWSHRDGVEQEMETFRDEADFYRTSQAYLYDLTAFAMWDTKLPYRRVLESLVPRGASLLDYGCGIGTDGLRLIRRGYRVSFADYANPSADYLKWRLARRGLDAPVFDLDAEVPGGFDAAFSFDVIEHVTDPFSFLSGLEQRAAVVMVNLLEEDQTDTHIHRPLPIDAILDRAQRKGLLHYRVYNQRSHLVAYRSGGTGGFGSRARRLSGSAARVITPVTDRARRTLIG